MPNAIFTLHEMPSEQAREREVASKNEQFKSGRTTGYLYRQSRMKRCVYTVLTGGYEPLNPQVVARESGLPFICFTDDPDTACEGWEIRPLERVFPADDIRNQRTYKLRPHHVLPEFDQSLYIDNSLLLRVAPEQIFEAADLASGLCLPVHSFRASQLDEFRTVVEHGVDDPRRVAEQLDHYQTAFPEVLAGPVFWTALMLRDHHAPKVQAAMEIWLAHVYRYSRRDQLSSAAAFHLAGLNPGTMLIDNYESPFHTWPHLAGRKAEQRIWKDRTEDSVVLRADYLELQRWLDAVQQERDALLHEHGTLLQERDTLLHERGTLQQEHEGLLNAHGTLQHERDALLRDREARLQERQTLLRSTSWRLTAPLRALKLAAMRVQKGRE